MKFASIMLQQPAPQGGMWEQLILIAVIIVIFYFFLIRPQMKRNKEQKKFRDSLQKGQRIVTIGGIHGKITEISETTAVIETEGGNKLKIEKTAIASSVADQLQDTK